MAGKARIVFKTRNLQRTKLDFSGGQKGIVIDSLNLERSCGNSIHTWHGAHSRVDGAEIHRLAEGEVAGIEEAAGLAAEHSAERVLHIAHEVVRIDADLERDLKRYVLRTIELKVFACEPPRLYGALYALLLHGGELAAGLLVDGLWLGGNEDCVPASCPALRGYGLFNNWV